MPTLEFSGKPIVYAHHLGVPFRPLVPVAAKSVLPSAPGGTGGTGGADRKSGKSGKGGKVGKAGKVGTDGALAVPEDSNLVVHGDNLHALKALMPRYAGRVNCVCIDPPYNTGNEGWAYNDKVNSPLMRRWLAESGVVDREDLERQDKWLSMMWPRLQLLRELLAEDGVIFVFIDDNEQHRLRMMMDEIFGMDNFIANIVWQKKYAPAGDAKYFSDNHDFIVCYAKNKQRNGESVGPFWRRNLLPRTDKQNKAYRHDSEDGKGLWRTDNLTAKSFSEEYYYPVVNPNTGDEHWPSQGTCWRTGKKKMAEWIADGRVFFGKSGKGRPQLKRYLDEVQPGVVPLTVWTHEEAGHTDGARKVLKDIFHDEQLPFDNPKPVEALKRVCQVAAGGDAIILDSFAGSGTTAHAVLALNAEDGGKRQFILVECEDYADKVTAERIRRVIKGVPKARSESLRKGLGGSFSFCKLGDSVDSEAMFAGKLPDYDTLARYVSHTATGVTLTKIRRGKDGFFGEIGNVRLHMIYEPDRNFLISPKASLDRETAERVGKAARAKGKRALVFAAMKQMSQNGLTPLGVTFCQMPYAMYRIFGNGFHAR